MRKVERDSHVLRRAIRRGIQGRHGIVYRSGAHDGARTWAYRKDLVNRLVTKGLLRRQNARDPFGASYTVRAIETLWPHLRARRLIPAIELEQLWRLQRRVRAELDRRTANLTRPGRGSLRSHLRQAYQEVLRQSPEQCTDPAGKTYTWARLARLPGFRARDVADSAHQRRVGSVFHALGRLAKQRVRDQKPGALDRRKDAYVLPKDAVRRAIRQNLLGRQHGTDVWGRLFRVRRRGKARPTRFRDHRLRFYEVYSRGPDGKAGTADDLVYPRPPRERAYWMLARALGARQPATGVRGGPARFRGGVQRGGVLRGRFGARARRMAPPGAMDDMMMEAAAPPPAVMKSAAATGSSGSGATAPVKRNVRVRDYFPETLLFKPSVITDDKGQAELEVAMADSITTWRMTASAVSRDGALGSASRGLKVFQDFFVDLDLPVALTQNDEVSIPVVVYNYLKKPQRVRLELQKAGWFDLLGGGRVQELTIQPAEVAATHYRIRVRALGRRKLQVRADGSAMSDAIRREIEVLPDGQEKNLVRNGRLEGTVKKTLKIPRESVSGASKVLVRLYPGVFSQVIEGMESMLRLPGG